MISWSVYFPPKLMHLLTLPDHVQESFNLLRIAETTIWIRDDVSKISLLRIQYVAQYCDINGQFNQLEVWFLCEI